MNAKSKSASSACQKLGAEEDAEERGFYISAGTAQSVLGIIEILSKSIRLIKLGLCPHNPGLGINGCSLCQDSKARGVSLTVPPHRNQFTEWFHEALRFMEEKLSQDKEVLG